MSTSSSKPLVVGMPFLHRDGRLALEPDHQVIESSHLDEIYAHAMEADALYAYTPFWVDAELISRCQNLKIIAVGGSGFNHVDLDAARAAGIVVTRGGGLGALSVAEHAMGLMLAVSKRLVENDAHVRTGKSFVNRRVADLYSEISGSTLAIVGFGSIGREIARIARHGFNMQVIAVTRDGNPVNCDDLQQTLRLREALEVADIVSLNVPLSPENRGLIGHAELAVMKPGSMLIDTSRGGVVDALALRHALLSGHLSGAGVDVFEPEPPPIDHPLIGLSNVVLSPHCAGFTRAASRRLSLFVAADIARTLRGEKPLGLIGPDTQWQYARAAQIRSMIPC